jgi:1,4-dihydroxy-2-naphthoate octaprenyltransferase
MCVLVGAYLVAVGGWPIFALGVAAILAALAYTGGPWPLGYHGLGELFVFLFFGLAAVVGTAYVQLGRLDARALACAVPIGALATAIIVVNNLRDRVNDARVGKRTLAVRLGRRGSIVEYASLLAIAYASSIVIATWQHRYALWLPLLSLPSAWGTLRRLIAYDGAALNPLLGATARLLAIFGALLSAGWLIGR